MLVCSSDKERDALERQRDEVVGLFRGIMPGFDPDRELRIVVDTLATDFGLVIAIDDATALTDPSLKREVDLLQSALPSQWQRFAESRLGGPMSVLKLRLLQQADSQYLLRM